MFFEAYVPMPDMLLRGLFLLLSCVLLQSEQAMQDRPSAAVKPSMAWWLPSPPAADVGLRMLSGGMQSTPRSLPLLRGSDWPAAGNIGGGGFNVYPPWRPNGLDYREKAPAAATPTMLQTRDASFAYRTVGVPGSVAGPALAHQKFGKLGWKLVLAPAIELAEKGFKIDRALAASMNSAIRSAPADTEIRRVYGKQQGKERWQAGDTLVLRSCVDVASNREQGPTGSTRACCRRSLPK